MKLLRSLASVLAALFLACLPASAQEETTLRVFSATDTYAITSVIDGFEETHPGIRVEYTEINTSELHEAVLRSPPGSVDVVISSAMDLQVDLVNRGLALRFDPSGQTSPEWAQWRRELYGFTFEPVVVIYNKAAFEDRILPRTRSELAGMIRDDPAFFDGRIGTYDIAVSGVGYLFAAQDARRGYQFSRLIESLGRARAKTYCCSGEIIDAVASGELVFGYNVMGSYALERAEQEGRIGVYLLEDYALVMTRTAFIPKTSPRKEAAAAFISYLLSPQGQQQIAANSALIAFDTTTNVNVKALIDRKPLLPIRLGPGLLGYLDEMKKKQFLQDWSTSMAGPSIPLE